MRDEICLKSKVGKVQRSVNLINLVKSFPTSTWFRNFASIQPRMSPIKFAKR